MARMLLTDKDWETLKPLLPFEKRGRPRKDDRLVIEGILWIMRTGAPWRDLPPEFGSWKTIHWRLHHWSAIGIWKNILNRLKKKNRSRIAYH